MLYGVKVAVCSEINTNYIIPLYEPKVNFLNQLLCLVLCICYRTVCHYKGMYYVIFPLFVSCASVIR
jgi:hypothetical protein